jgi:hypothetical protein
MMRATVAGLCVMGVCVAVALVLAQEEPANTRFEYGVFRSCLGPLTLRPFPVLEADGVSYPLVARGKFGAGPLLREFDGQRVELSGARIENGENRMLELKPGSVRALGEAAQLEPVVDLGDVSLTGEIVDTKCHFGVMNPGSGKVHKACAIRCIRGGIPPGLLVRDRSGTTRTLMLAGRIPLDRIAEPVTLRGRLERRGTLLTLCVE